MRMPTARRDKGGKYAGRRLRSGLHRRRRVALAVVVAVSISTASFFWLAGVTGDSHSYSLAQVQTGLMQHPSQWSGRVVTVHATATHISPLGFALVDSDRNLPEMEVTVKGFNLWFEVTLWRNVIARMAPIIGIKSQQGVFTVRLPPANECARYNDGVVCAPSELR